MYVLPRYSMTPLMYAAREGRLTVVESLLAVTTDVNCQDSKGYTVCYAFCRVNYFKVKWYLGIQLDWCGCFLYYVFHKVPVSTVSSQY